MRSEGIYKRGRNLIRRFEYTIGGDLNNYKVEEVRERSDRWEQPVVVQRGTMSTTVT